MKQEYLWLDRSWENSSRVDPNLGIGGRFGNWPDGQGGGGLAAPIRTTKPRIVTAITGVLSPLRYSIVAGPVHGPVTIERNVTWKTQFVNWVSTNSTR
jgi:hypothetical protein